jgi:hypothetical protein
VRDFIFWSSSLAVSLLVAVGCGSDLAPAVTDSSRAGSAAHAGKLTGSLGATGGAYDVGGSPDLAGGFAAGGLAEGGAPQGVAGSGEASGGSDDLAGAATGGASAEAPPFVCDRADIAVPLGTWWASYCLAKASTRSCSADFDACYAATKGFLESGLCTEDDDASKLDDVACAAAALAYACEPPLVADMGCAGDTPRAEFLNAGCRDLDAELRARVATCVPQ